MISRGRERVNLETQKSENTRKAFEEPKKNEKVKYSKWVVHTAFCRQNWQINKSHTQVITTKYYQNPQYNYKICVSKLL